MPDPATYPWGRPATAADLVALGVARRQFAEQWAEIGATKFDPVAFDGQLADVDALDYLHYESFRYPACGIEGAALVCGDVLRRALGFEWVISHSGMWFIASGQYPWVIICPLTRLQEIFWAGIPQFGRHMWFLQRAALDCFAMADPAQQTALRAILNSDPDPNYIEELSHTLRNIGKL